MKGIKFLFCRREDKGVAKSRSMLDSGLAAADRGEGSLAWFLLGSFSEINRSSGFARVDTFDKCGGISMYTEYNWRGNFWPTFGGDRKAWSRFENRIDSMIERLLLIYKLKFNAWNWQILRSLRFSWRVVLPSRRTIGKNNLTKPRSFIKRYDVEGCWFPCWLLATENFLRIILSET